MAAISEHPCPKCGGQMWDETQSQYWGDGKTKTGKSKPIAKCKDRNCDGVQWPPRNGGLSVAQAAAIAAPRSAPASARQEFNHPPAGSMPFDGDTEKLDRLFQLHDVCLDHAIRQSHKLAEAKIGDSPEAVSARAAALMIQASKA